MSETRWLDPLETRAWRGLMCAHARLVAQLDAELLASSGISLPDYEVLVHLSEADSQRLRMSELALRLEISPSGLTRRLDGLVASGMVERVQCPEDRRGTFAVLTELGAERLEAAAPAHVAQVRRWFVDRLTRDQLCALADAMASIIAGSGACSSSEVRAS